MITIVFYFYYVKSYTNFFMFPYFFVFGYRRVHNNIEKSRNTLWCLINIEIKGNVNRISSN